MVIDEISLLLNRRVVPRVATLTEITDILKKTEQSQRVLDEAGETFTLDVIHDDDANGDETISIEKLTQESDISPIIRLVDTTIFTALQRRASDIHMETRDDCVVIKYRIDGVLQEAMKPIAKERHSTIISRIKVMSELDIAERRVPRMGASGCATTDASSTSASPSCPASTARMPCSACWTKSRSARSSRS